MKKHITVITETKELDAFISRFSSSDFVAVDTEFIRETTYYPKLCLVQLSNGVEACCIDPLASNIDLSSLFSLMDNKDICKVFHAGKQDMEIFVYLTGKVPSPVYDTQIAAMVCGLGEQVGYDKLVSHFCNISLDKSSRFTNWAERPLSDRQISYAIDDVVYLADIYPKLRQKLSEGGRDGWVEGEMTSFADLSGYITDPETAWRRLKPRSQKADFLIRLKYLAAWRETEAIKRNMPRGRILRDDTLMDLAGSNPKNDNQLNKIRGFPKNQNNPFRSEIIAVLNDAASDDNTLEIANSGYKDAKPPAATVELLRVLLKYVAEQQDVAPRLIASAQQLDELAIGKHHQHPCLSGWRFDIFGQKALQLIDGKLALSLSDNAIILTERD